MDVAEQIHPDKCRHVEHHVEEHPNAMQEIAKCECLLEMSVIVEEALVSPFINLVANPVSHILCHLHATKETLLYMG